jgi:hypothetical protein
LPECKVRLAMANVFTAFGAGPAGAEHPSQNNLAAFGIAPNYISPVPG